MVVLPEIDLVLGLTNHVYHVTSCVLDLDLDLECGLDF